jgi:endonuclease-3
MNRKDRFKEILAYFLEKQPNPVSELDYGSSFQLLVAVILSAQCTDKRINKITPDLFAAFPNAEAMSRSSVEEIFEYIKSCSYPNNKAKHLFGMACELVARFGGDIPQSSTDLESLPGVGRKTANVITSIVFDAPALAVDTHVFRVAARLGLSVNAKTPLETERQLMKYIPKTLVPRAHHWLILHGRYVCVARKPKCGECGIALYCAYNEKQIAKVKTKN